jgi:uncharacterized protein
LLGTRRIGVIRSVTCEEILREFREKLLEKFGYTEQRAEEATNEVRMISRLVSITNTLRAVPADPDDDIVVECAVVGEATHIITGDKRHLLPLGHYQDIAIVSASDFLAFVRDQ